MFVIQLFFPHFFIFFENASHLNAFAKKVPEIYFFFLEIYMKFTCLVFPIFNCFFLRIPDSFFSRENPPRWKVFTESSRKLYKFFFEKLAKMNLNYIEYVMRLVMKVPSRALELNPSMLTTALQDFIQRLAL